MQKYPDYKLALEKVDLQTQNWIKNNSEKNNAIITIPVVVHVVWNTNAENISNAKKISERLKYFRHLYYIQHVLPKVW